MGTKISELASAESLTGDELIPIVQTGSTKKTTVNDVNYFANTYTTEEVRNGTWIDGKPLYKMFISSQNAQCSTDGTSVSKVLKTINNVDTCLLLFSSMLTSSGNFSITLPAYTTSFSLRSRVVLNKNTNTNELQVRADNAVTGYNDYNVYCLIIYTKTTDTATRGGEQLRSMNTGSLVGMGDRVEVTLEKEEQPEEITETKSAEVDKLESEEGSGDSR